MATINADFYVCGSQLGGLNAALTVANAGYKVVVGEWTVEDAGMCIAGVLQVDYSSNNASGLTLAFWRAVQARAEAVGRVWNPDPNHELALHKISGLPKNISPLWVSYVVEQMYAAHPNITILRSVDIVDIQKTTRADGGTRQTAVLLSNGDTITFKQWLDASYEGWLQMAAGIPHEYGRTDRLLHGEENAGVATWNVHGNDIVDFPVRTIEGDVHRQRTYAPTQENGKGSLTSMGHSWRFVMSTMADRVSWASLGGPLEDLGYRPAMFADFISELKQRGANNIGYISSSHPFDGEELNGLHTTNPTNLNEPLMARKYPRLRTPDECRAYFDEMFLLTFGKIYAAYTSTELNPLLKQKMDVYALPGQVYQTRYWRAPGCPPQPYRRTVRRPIGPKRITWNNFNQPKPDPCGPVGYNVDIHYNHIYHEPISGKTWKEGETEPHLTGTWQYPLSGLKPHPRHSVNGLFGWIGSASALMEADLRIESVMGMVGEMAGHVVVEALNRGKDAGDVTYAEVRPRLLAAGFVLS